MCTHLSVLSSGRIGKVSSATIAEDATSTLRLPRSSCARRELLGYASCYLVGPVGVVKLWISTLNLKALNLNFVSHQIS